MEIWYEEYSLSSKEGNCRMNNKMEIIHQTEKRRWFGENVKNRYYDKYLYGEWRIVVTSYGRIKHIEQFAAFQIRLH